MFGYRYYRDSPDRQVAVVLATDEHGNSAYWAEVINYNGKVVQTYEGLQINLVYREKSRGWKLEKEVITG
jgi:hypothetical protein